MVQKRRQLQPSANKQTLMSSFANWLGVTIIITLRLCVHSMEPGEASGTRSKQLSKQCALKRPMLSADAPRAPRAICSERGRSVLGL